LKKVLTLILSLTCVFLHAQMRKADSIVLATYTYSTNDRVSNLQPLAAYLTSKTGVHVSVISYRSVQALMNALRSKEADMAMINTLGYISFQNKFPAQVIPLVSLDPGSKDITNYGGCVLARKESGIRAISDLPKRDSIFSMALVNVSSTSGNLVPRLLFNSNGISRAEDRVRVYYAGTHKQVVDDLLSGKAGIGGCGCHEYDKAVQQDIGVAEKIIKIADYNDIPLGPIVYRAGLNVPTVKKMKAALLEVHTEQPAVFRNFCAGWTEFLEATRFREAKDADYDSFRQLFGKNESLWKLLDSQ
jgi:phosphonate transport system substrate-binding protein